MVQSPPAALGHRLSVTYQLRKEPATPRSPKSITVHETGATPDRPIAIHLWFSDADQPSVFGPLGWIFGYPHITHTLTYVLGGNHRPGSVITNPYYDNGAILVLRGKTVATGHWYTEMRNIERDIETSFPSIPSLKSLKYIAISADTDDTGGDSLARMTGLRLSGLGHETR